MTLRLPVLVAEDGVVGDFALLQVGGEMEFVAAAAIAVVDVAVAATALPEEKQEAWTVVSVLAGTHAVLANAVLVVDDEHMDTVCVEQDEVLQVKLAQHVCYRWMDLAYRYIRSELVVHE